MEAPRTGDSSEPLARDEVDDRTSNGKPMARHVSDAGSSANRDGSAAIGVRSQREAPAIIRDMSLEDRAALEKQLVRKIDRRLLPMLVLMYIMNYIDRNNIASARLQGLQTDLNLSDTEYLTCVSILFVGYLLMQVPSNLFLNKMGKPAIYLPSAMIIWGVISTSTAATQSFGGLLAVRFFLGFVEAAYFPGVLWLLSSWYTRKELGLRIAIMYSGSLLSGAFSGLIAAGILSGLDGARGLAAWRWLFIIEGAITIVLAFCSLFILPNLPRTTAFFSEPERALAVWRLEEDIGEDDWLSSDDQSFKRGWTLAVQDIKMWVLMILVLGCVSSGSVTNFFPSVVKTVAQTDIEALLLTSPPYVLCVITTFLNAWHADKTGERYWHITIPLWVTVVAFIIAVTTTGIGPRYFAMMIMLSIYPGYVVALAWISNVLPRPPAKRAVALAMINAVSNASSIYASFMYTGSPRYVDCLTALMAIVAATVLRFMLVRLNKKLDRGEPVEGVSAGGGAVPDTAAKRGFRFLY